MDSDSGLKDGVAQANGKYVPIVIRVRSDISGAWLICTLINILNHILIHTLIHTLIDIHIAILLYSINCYPIHQSKKNSIEACFVCEFSSSRWYSWRHSSWHLDLLDSRRLRVVVSMCAVVSNSITCYPIHQSFFAYSTT